MGSSEREDEKRGCSGQAWRQVKEVSTCGEPQLVKRDARPWTTGWSGSPGAREEKEIVESSYPPVLSQREREEGRERKRERCTEVSPLKGDINRIFTSIFHFQGGTGDIDGCHSLICSVVLFQILPTTCTLMPHGSPFRVSWTHATLHPMVDE